MPLNLPSNTFPTSLKNFVEDDRYQSLGPSERVRYLNDWSDQYESALRTNQFIPPTIAKGVQRVRGAVVYEIKAERQNADDQVSVAINKLVAPKTGSFFAEKYFVDADTSAGEDAFELDGIAESDVFHIIKELDKGTFKDPRLLNADAKTQQILANRLRDQLITDRFSDEMGVVDPFEIIREMELIKDGEGPYKDMPEEQLLFHLSMHQETYDRVLNSRTIEPAIFRALAVRPEMDLYKVEGGSRKFRRFIPAPVKSEYIPGLEFEKSAKWDLEGMGYQELKLTIKALDHNVYPSVDKKVQKDYANELREYLPSLIDERSEAFRIKTKNDLFGTESRRHRTPGLKDLIISGSMMEQTVTPDELQTGIPDNSPNQMLSKDLR